jgi:indole-3-acetate monooxygenase
VKVDAIPDRVRALLPEISERSAEFESLRRIPRDVVDKLRAAGCFRMAVPRAFGGAELDLCQRLPIIEMVSTADGSAGWTVAIGNEAPIILSRCAARAFEDLYAKGPDVVLAGGAAATGTADVVAGGYRVSGRWAWASGSLHADFLLGNCVVREDGKSRPGPLPGRPETRAVVVPRSEARVLDTWRASGLRATGSNDMVIEDAFVPFERTLDFAAGEPCVAGPLYRAFGLQGGAHLAAVALGIAQGALDDIAALAKSGKQRLWAATTLAEQPLFQHQLGEADMTLRAARRMLYAQAETFLAEVHTLPSGLAMSQHPLSRECRATATWVARAAARVTDAAYNAGGGTSLADSCPLQRRFRDVHALTQHAILAETMLMQHGAALAGAEAVA